MRIFERTAALEAFAAPARARAAIWRVVVSLILIAGLIVLAGLAISYGGTLFGADFEPFLDDLESGTRGGTLLLLASFILWWLGLWAAVRLMHRRGLRSLLGPRGGVDPRRFGAGLAVALALGLASILAGALAFGAPGFSGAAFADWLIGAAIAAPLLLIQTGAEEALFRGYLLQQMAARFRSAFAWALLPSILFGLGHWSPDAPGGAAPTMLATGAVGVILAVVTARTGDVSAAWGLHFGVNLLAILLVAPPGPLSGLALLTWPADETTLSGLVWLDVAAITICGAAAAIWALRRARRGG